MAKAARRQVPPSPRPDGDARDGTTQGMALEPAEITELDAAGARPERTCAVTRERREPAELIRFVRAPDGTVTPDLAQRLPGRGVWISLSKAIVDRAGPAGAFARGLKQPVQVPLDLAGLVERLLAQRAIAALAMANKAGLVVAGFAKTEAAIGSGDLAALVHARDGAADGCEKLDRKLRALRQPVAQAPAGEGSEPVHGRAGGHPAQAPSAEQGTAVIVKELEASELSLALGRENVVHAAVSNGGAAQYFLNEVERLRRYRSAPQPDPARRPRRRPNTEQA